MEYIAKVIRKEIPDNRYSEYVTLTLYHKNGTGEMSVMGHIDIPTLAMPESPVPEIGQNYILSILPAS